MFFQISIIQKKIGSEYFLSCSLPEQEYEYEDEEFETSMEVEESYDVKLIDGLEFGIVTNENDANSEVLLLSQEDIAPLKIGPSGGQVFTFAFQTGRAKAGALFAIVGFSRRCVFPTEEP